MNRNKNTTGGLPLNLQLFAEEGTEQEHADAETGAENKETEFVVAYVFNHFVNIFKSNFVKVNMSKVIS